MKHATEPLKNTILYYPTISIPSNQWLRHALLYWDEIGSIIPRRYDENPLASYSAHSPARPTGRVASVRC